MANESDMANSNDAITDSAPHERLKNGSLVAERYKIVRLLGTGGMGSVYLVEHILLRQQQAMKVLDQATVSDKAWLRFQREAKATNQFDHPGLVKVHDFGITADGKPFLIMDFCPGRTLAQIIKEEQLQLGSLLDIFIQICFALRHAHEQGVVHRDIKPTNIIIVLEGEVAKSLKIVDFGIAKVANEEDVMALTRTGELSGTPYYMSPEQCLGRPVDARSDVYSLGCVFFEALTSAPPFIGATALTTMMKHESETAPSLKEASLGKKFPSSLEEIVAKMLRKKPQERYQNLEAVVNALTSCNSSLNQPSQFRWPTLAAVNAVAIKFVTIAAALFVGILVFFCSVGFILRVNRHSVSTDKIALPATEQSVSRTASNEGIAYPVYLEHPQEIPDSMMPIDYYSSASDLQNTTRHFLFPKDLKGLRIRAVNGSTRIFVGNSDEPVLANHEIDAIGNITVKNFAPLRLFVAPEAAYPILLRWFRSDEIGSLRFAKGCCSSKCLQAIQRYKALRELDFYGSPITDVNYLNVLPNLEWLGVSNTKITGQALCRIKRLNELTTLHANQITGPSGLLKALQGGKLNELSLAATGLTDEDLRILGDDNLSRLSKLYLNENPGITDEGLVALAVLPSLNVLDVAGCNVTPASIPTFKKLQKLKELRIPVRRWSAQKVSELSQALPKCRIYATQQTAD